MESLQEIRYKMRAIYPMLLIWLNLFMRRCMGERSEASAKYLCKKGS